MTAFKKELRSNYPQHLTLDNVRIILRISKRKASWMLQNGYIKCKNSGKQTRQYTVEIDDLFKYLEKVKNDAPEVKVPVGLFNARQSKTHRDASAVIAPRIIHEKPPEEMALWLADEWYDASRSL